MKILRKEVSIGECNFSVGLDRNIISDTFEEFPDIVEFLFKYSKTSEDDEDFIIRAMRDKNLHILLNSKEHIKDLVYYALPKMLKKADEVDGTDNAQKVNEIIDYIEDNEADELFVSKMFEFIMSGFTPETTEKKPKVAVTIK